MFGWAVLMAVNLRKLSWLGRVCVLPRGEEKAACVKQIAERKRALNSGPVYGLKG